MLTRADLCGLADAVDEALASHTSRRTQVRDVAVRVATIARGATTAQIRHLQSALDATVTRAGRHHRRGAQVGGGRAGRASGATRAAGPEHGLPRLRGRGSLRRRVDRRPALRAARDLRRDGSRGPSAHGDLPGPRPARGRDGHDSADGRLVQQARGAGAGAPRLADGARRVRGRLARGAASRQERALRDPPRLRRRPRVGRAAGAVARPRRQQHLRSEHGGRRVRRAPAARRRATLARRTLCSGRP